MNSERAVDWAAVLALQRTTHALLGCLAERLAAWQLSGSEITVIANLAVHEGCMMSVLSKEAGIRPSTLTGTLDRLVERGLVERVSRTHDRRSVFVTLTPSGREAGAHIKRVIGELEEAALGTMSRAAWAGLRRGLEALEGACR